MAKTVVFTYGRFNPPTKGHAKLIDKIKDVAQSKNADHVIVASHTQDNKKNPLPQDVKVEHLNNLFPETNFKCSDKTNPTFVNQLALLDKEYDNVVFVAGSDRVETYTSVLNKYNGKDFTFKNVEVVSAGQRDPDGDTVEGISATQMREYAINNDFESFKKALPSDYTLSENLFNEVRKCLN